MLLKGVEARKGMAAVKLQMDPWIPESKEMSLSVEDEWYGCDVKIVGMPNLQM